MAEHTVEFLDGAGVASWRTVEGDETDPAIGCETHVALITGQPYISGGAGAVAANTPRTTLASDDPAVASLSVMDDWDETDRAKVNLIAAQAGVDGNAGAASAKTVRTVTASDSPDVSALGATGDAAATQGSTGSISAKLRTVTAQLNTLAGYLDGVETALGAGVAQEAGGNLAAAAASLSVLDDWDETDRAKVNPIVGQAGVAGGAGAAGATVLRVVLATDTTVPNVTGPAADDAPVSGNPVRVGGRAVTAEKTAVAAGDTTDFITDKTNKLIVLPYANPENFVSYASQSDITNTTTVAAIAAGAGSLRNYIGSTMVTCSHATVGTIVEIRDGSGGTILWSGFCAPNGGGWALKHDPPLKGTAATAVHVVCVTNASAVRANISGYQGV